MWQGASGGARALSGGAQVWSPETSTSLEGLRSPRKNRGGLGPGTALVGACLVCACCPRGRGWYSEEAALAPEDPHRHDRLTQESVRSLAEAGCVVGPRLQSLTTEGPEQAEVWHVGDPQKGPCSGPQATSPPDF